MEEEPYEVPVRMLGCMVDERPHIFIHDPTANHRFLKGIDPDYWAYQSRAHAHSLESDCEDDRQRAATALRLVYGQSLETLFALIGAFVQCPHYPLAWLMRYINRDLRAIVGKIDRRESFPSALKQQPSWEAASSVVHQHLDESKRAEVTERFARLWGRLAAQFLADSFEPEYNSLKHGMRASVGGFSVAVGQERTLGLSPPPEEMRTVGGSEYGSSFWMPSRKLDGSKYTYELSTNVTCAWAPIQFVLALPLIGMSIRNIVGRLLILSGDDPTTTRFTWPADIEAFSAPWRELPSIGQMSSSHTTDLPNYREASVEDILRTYKS